ncbi:hypothetical protein K1T71_003250 [Dendrolimus kikuchii]|uniref:Uncharacterized protein n=1 Tax=Dendrolimus kikuchii TaxID=765133 RepID=A0ACC1DBF7_9NEOP|nr:hypothetical protein K1T71_003250 [Dendrolimus kikuchii]
MKYYLLLSIFGVFANCERLHEQIYSSIKGGAACFRRLNGTHQAGCSSSDKGAVGVVQMISDITDAQWIAFNSSAGPYMAIVNTDIFKDVIEVLMGHPENVAGVVIFNNVTDSTFSFTQESRCPNEYSSGFENQCSSSSSFVWNDQGTGLLRRNIPFPIFYLPDSKMDQIEKIQECYLKFNLDKTNQKGRPLCSVQLNSFMFAAVNSEVCLRRSATSALLSPTKVCDPLGDNNVYYSLFPRPKEKETANKSIILVTARIDSASLFDGLSPGTASSVVGTVTFLTAAATLAKMIPVTEANLYDNNVLWTLFNGEAFDYIGSQRVAYDLKKGSWPYAPLKPSNIRLHVEIGQIGGAMTVHKNDNLWPLNVYAPNYSVYNTEVSEFVSMMLNNTMAVNYIVSDNLPPSSLHSFRKILKNVTSSGDLPELLIVDHDEIFTNLFYNSALDQSDKIGYFYHNISIGSDGTFLTTAELLLNGTMEEFEPQVKISRVATAFAKTLYQKVTGKAYYGNITASAHLVDEILYCLLMSQACRLLYAVDFAQSEGGEEKMPTRAPPLYVGVAPVENTAPTFAGHLLALLTGQQLNLNKTGCDAPPQPGYSKYWLRGWNHTGVCIQTTMNFSQALSPAFVITDYDMKSGDYSTWTESVWQTMWARVFVSAGGGGATVAVISGCIVTVVAALLTYWLKRHAAIAFAKAPAAVVVNEDAASGILRTVNC